MKNKSIEVGFWFRGQLFTFCAENPEPLGFVCEPGTGFKKMSRLEKIFIDCKIKPQGEQVGEVVASWNRAEKRLIDAAPTDEFLFQPERGPEQEELFNRLLITCEQCVREAIELDQKAREGTQAIDPTRKYLS